MEVYPRKPVKDSFSNQLESYNLQDPNIVSLLIVILHEENSIPNKKVFPEFNQVFRPNFQFPGIWGIEKQIKWKQEEKNHTNLKGGVSYRIADNLW